MLQMPCRAVCIVAFPASRIEDESFFGILQKQFIDAVRNRLVSTAFKKYGACAHKFFAVTSARMGHIEIDISAFGNDHQTGGAFVQTTDGVENEITSAALQNISEAPELARKIAGHIRGKLVVSCSDLITVKVIPIWAELDLFCGKEYLMASYDNLQAVLPAAFPSTGITGIDYSRSGAAQMAVKLLIQSVINRQKQFYQTVKFPTRLVIRESAFEQYKYKEESL